MQHMEYFNIAIDGPAGAGKSAGRRSAASYTGARQGPFNSRYLAAIVPTKG